MMTTKTYKKRGEKSTWTLNSKSTESVNLVGPGLTGCSIRNVARQEFDDEWEEVTSSETY